MFDVTAVSRFLLLAGVLAGLQMQADSGGALVGSVIDPAGLVIPNVAIVLSTDGEQVLSKTNTDNMGQFRFTGLPAGRYSLKVSSPGFVDKLVAGLQVEDGKETRVPAVTLQIVNPFPNGCGDTVQVPWVSFHCLAKGRTALTGTVLHYPASKKTLEGVTISVTKLGSQLAANSVQPDHRGHFGFSNLEPGVYSLEARSEGYHPFTIDRVQIRANHTTEIDPQLQLKKCPSRGPCIALKKVRIPQMCL